MDAAHVAIGLVTGGLFGATGVGAGALLVPALIYLGRMPLASAVGVSVAMQAIPVGLHGAWTYYQAGSLPVRATALVALGMVVGISVGAHIALRSMASVATQGVLRRVTGALLIGIGAVMCAPSRSG